MKPKSLITLVLIMAVLAGLVLFRQSTDESVSIIEQVQLKKLLPEGLAVTDVTKIEVHAAGRSESAVVLAKSASTDEWTITSQFNAPVDQAKLDGYLAMLVGLEGEFRESVLTDTGLAAYDLGDDAGFRVKGYTSSGDAPAFQLIVGKSPAAGTVFARTEGSKQVYSVNKNPRQEAGIYNADVTTAPKPEPWMNKKVLDVTKGSITNVTLSMPDKELGFEYREIPSDEPDPATEVDEESGEASTPEPVANVTEYEWVLASGGTGTTLKTAGLDRVLNKLTALNATTIVDPTTLAEWGLDAPAYTCRISIGGQDDEIVIHGGRPDISQPAYVRLTTGNPNLIYKVSKYDFEQLFPKGSVLFDLEGWDVAKEDISEIEYTTGHDTVRLQKEADVWTLEEPTANLALIQTKIDGVATDLAKIKGDDYAGISALTGLESPAMRARFTDSSGVERTLRIGDPARHIDGYYARLDGAELALAVAKSSVDNVFVDPKDFYEAGVFDIGSASITHIEIAQASGSYTLDKTDFGWTVTSGGIPVDADTDAVEDVARALESLQADDLIFGDARIQGGFYASLAFTTDEGTEHKINLEIEQSGGHPATTAGKNVAFVLNKDTVKHILPPIESLLKSESESIDTAPEPLTVIDTPTVDDAP